MSQYMGGDLCTDRQHIVPVIRHCMTVSAETKKATYSGDGSTTCCSTVLMFASNDEVTVTKVVTATGLETEFTLGTVYTLTGVGTGSAVKR